MTTITPESVKDRVGTLGGSDAAAIMGQSGFSTLMKVFLETIGEQEPTEQTENMYWGTVFEDNLANRYMEDTGARLHRVNQRLAHKEHPFVAGHIDRRIVGTKGIWEGKTTGFTKDWGPAGTDQVPPYVICQVMTYMAITGAEYCDVSALLFLFGRREFRTYRVGRDKDLVADIEESLAHFFHNHIEPRVPPDPTTLQEAARKWAASTGTTVQADSGMMWDLVQLANWRAFMKVCEEIKGKLEVRSASSLKHADTLLGPQGQTLLTWKQRKGSELFDKAAFKAAHPELYAQYAKTGKPSRTFLPRYKALDQLILPLDAGPPANLTDTECQVFQLLMETQEGTSDE